MRCTLVCYPRIEVIGEASDGEEAVACVAKMLPTRRDGYCHAQHGRNRSDPTNQETVSIDRHHRTHAGMSSTHTNHWEQIRREEGRPYKVRGRTMGAARGAARKVALIRP